MNSQEKGQAPSTLSVEARERLEKALDAWAVYSGAVIFPGGADLRISDIRAALQALAPEEGGWRPIETAPKDGTTIDVWRPEGGRDTVFWGYPPHECGEMGGLCDSDWHRIRAPGWVCTYFGEFLGRKHAPFTHWRPLSAPPEALGGKS